MMIHSPSFLSLAIVAILINVSSVFGQSVPSSSQESRIAAEITRLGSSHKAEGAASVKALVTIGKPAAPALVEALSDPRSDVRALAAEALRAILAADPTGAPNYHERAFWEQRIAQLKSGMPLDEALKVLLPSFSPTEREKANEGSSWGGGGGTAGYRLDDYWVIALYLWDAQHKKLHDAAPALGRQVRSAWVQLPDNYTGEWVTWRVNGQKAHEIQCRNGKYDGTVTAYYDDGSRCYQQHYINGVCHGASVGWHQNGKTAYEGHIEQGKQVGTWRWWNERGEAESVQEYEAGERVEKKEK